MTGQKDSGKKRHAGGDWEIKNMNKRKDKRNGRDLSSWQKGQKARKSKKYSGGRERCDREACPIMDEAIRRVQENGWEVWNFLIRLSLLSTLPLNSLPIWDTGKK